MLATRFIRARKSKHVDHRGEIRQRSARSHICKGVEQIGLWQLHSIDPKVPRDQQFAAVKSLQDDGIIRTQG